MILGLLLNSDVLSFLIVCNCFGFHMYLNLLSSILKIRANLWREMVMSARFERATVCLEGRCSIQLSYDTTVGKVINGF